MFKKIFLVVFIFLSFYQTRVLAETVTLEHRGLVLNANWIKASETWQSEPVVLMIHGTLAHGRMEIMDTLQSLFSEAGISSLSLTLSLGQSDRNGMYDCNTVHRHKHMDALDEIGLWSKWLQNQGAENIILLGHSRGGNQAAWYASEIDDPAVHKLVLIAPALWNEIDAAADYGKKYNESLNTLLTNAQKLVAAGKADTEIKTRGFIYCKDATATAEAIVSYYHPDERFHTPFIIPSIKQPVMVILGSEDNAFENMPEYFKPMAEDGSIKLNIIEGADHFFRDLYADEAVEAIQAFIGE